jgi:hypothetical protein
MLSPRALKAALAVALVAIVATVYHRVLSAELLNWDDQRFLAGNPLFQGDTTTYVWQAIATVQFEAYQPLHLLAYLPDKLLWPTNAFGFHAIELALFATAAVMVYLLAVRRASAPAAFAAALAFALHPLCVEPVAWVTARKDLLALVLVLVALAREDRAAPRRWIAIACFVAALLTKSASVSFPVVLVAWLHWMNALPWRQAVRRAWPYAIPAAAAAVVVTWIWARHGMIAPAHDMRLLDAPATFGIYAARIVAPVGLSPLYPDHAPALAGVACLVVLAAIVVLRRRLPAPARFALVAFIAVLLPVSNVVPIARFADRYVLVALAVIVPALAIACDRRRTLALAILAPVLVAAAWQSERLTAAWHDSIALWQRAVEVQPDALLAHLKLGETLRDAGRDDEAVAQYHEAIRVAPDSMLGYAGLFYARATAAERAGTLPAGTAARWLAELGGALTTGDRFAVMFGEVAATRCMPCKDALLVLGLRTWPQTDDALYADAEDALVRGVPDEALVFLAQVQQRDARYAPLMARAARANSR